MARARYYEIDYAGSVQRLWIVVVTACASAPPTPPQPSAPAGPTPVPVPAARAALDARFILHEQEHCGGARMPDPTPAARPVPPRKHRLLVMPGDRYTDTAPPLRDVMTESDGTFTADLPAGRYCIARPRGAKPSASPGPHVDLACLVERWQQCDAVVDVPVKAAQTIEVHEPCAWSICYHGPPPP